MSVFLIENELAVRQFEREGSLYMPKGERLMWHAHHFGHPTVVYTGAMRIDTLRVKKWDAMRRPLEAEVESSTVVRATDRHNWHYIAAGVWHAGEALEDDTRYGCWYPVRGPSAVTLGHSGQLPKEPKVRIDEHGRKWALIDEGIECVTSETAPWPPAFE